MPSVSTAMQDRAEDSWHIASKAFFSVIVAETSGNDDVSAEELYCGGGWIVKYLKFSSFR